MLDLGKRLGGSFASSFGAVAGYAAQVLVVVADIHDVLANRQRNLEDILGQLLFQVAVADAAVGVSGFVMSQNIRG